MCCDLVRVQFMPKHHLEPEILMRVRVTRESKGKARRERTKGKNKRREGETKTILFFDVFKKMLLPVIGVPDEFSKDTSPTE